MSEKTSPAGISKEDILAILMGRIPRDSEEAAKQEAAAAHQAKHQDAPEGCSGDCDNCPDSPDTDVGFNMLGDLVGEWREVIIRTTEDRHLFDQSAFATADIVGTKYLLATALSALIASLHSVDEDASDFEGDAMTALSFIAFAIIHKRFEDGEEAN